MKKLMILLSVFCSTVFAQEYERNILIEVFTNSHCPLCPAAHSTIDSYLASNANADRVRYIYYHMIYPYSDDQLYHASSEYSADRDKYYGPFGSTPKAFFDGESQSNNYSSWSSIIDSKLAVNTPVEIELSGTKNGLNVTINAYVTMSSSVPGGDLVIHYVAVEDVNYDGRNGIDNHKNVMRAMYPSADGQSITVTANQTVSESFTLSSNWVMDNVTFVVFIHNESTKEILQSEWIDYNELNVTDVADESTTPNEFELYQNYPNPFNPSTVIRFSLPRVDALSSVEVHVSLKIFNILGSEVTTLVNETKAPGTYEVVFDASKLPSGIYFYKLQYGGFSATKKLTLIK